MTTDFAGFGATSSVFDQAPPRPAGIRRATLCSVLLHSVAIGGLWYGTLALPTPQDEDAVDTAVMVELVTLADMSGDAPSAVESSASVSQVSAGAQSIPVPPVDLPEPDIVEPETPPPEPIPPATPVPVMPQPLEEPPAAQPVEPPSAPLLTASSQTETEEAAPASEPAPVDEPVELPISPPPSEKVEPAPAVVEPTKPVTPPPKVETPKEPKKTKKPKAVPAWNGGKSEADTAAASASTKKASAKDGSGSATVTKYPGLIQRKLRKALRFPKGAGSARGEVQVRFVVAASGSVSGIEIVASSGHAVLDQEAIATVKRAAPFPPIPTEANRASWTFTMPLGFVR